MIEKENVIAVNQATRLDRRALSRFVQEGTGEVLVFGLTPPRIAHEREKVEQIAARTLERIRGLDIDGLILYDLDDESDRTDQPRPFPFSATMDPARYLEDWLGDWGGPTIVYRSVGKYDEAAISRWLADQSPEALSVFVGASSATKPVQTSLKRALQVRADQRPDLPLGGVAIPERHAANGTEHLRLRKKQADGCSFFVTQVVYDVLAAKDLLSDYAYSCQADGVQPAPIIITLSLCGSEKTLEFLEWLGIHVPRWVQNELRHDKDPLGFSLGHCLRVAQELSAFCRHLDLPFGFNIESVSNRRVEIEAAVELTGQVRKLLAS